MKKIGVLKRYTSKEIADSRISIGFEGLDRELFKPERCYDLLGETGVKYARCQTGWARCETARGSYDFSWLDDVVDNLSARGVQVWMNVGYGNPLYMQNIKNKTAVGCVPLFYGEECLSAWINFVSALAKHFAGRVQMFEIWNEPESPNFWYPSLPDPKAYVRLYDITAKEILKHIPDAQLIATVASEYDFDYMQGFFEAMDGRQMDYFAYHAHSMYPEICHGKGQFYPENVARIRKLLDLAGYTETKLIQGEAGQPSWAPVGHWLYKDGFENPRAQAVWLLRRYFMDFSMDVALSSFFMIADIWEKPYEMATKTIPRAQANGILNGLVYTPKLSYTAMCHVVSVLQGDIISETDDIDCEVSICDEFSVLKLRFIKNGQPMYVYYLPKAPSEDVYYEGVCTIRTEVPLRDAVLVDMYTGEVFLLPQTDAEYSGLPLANYPMVLTTRAAIELQA